jgi:hypothetical protein
LPYHITGFAVRVIPRPEVEKSTFKLLLGTLIYTVWVLLLSGLVWRVAGVGWGLATAALLPILGVVGQRFRERWRGAWDDARRFFLVRLRPELVQRLGQEQREIFEETGAVYDAWQRGELGQSGSDR